MNARQVNKFVLAYLERSGCQLIEKTPDRVTVKLSPEADRALTNRPYYWGFVDRTGTEPETLTYTWLFNRANTDQQPPVRAFEEDVHFGSRRLQQLFDVVRSGGRNVMLFEEPTRGLAAPMGSLPYTTWLGVNFKVGYECDMKREELYNWGISLATGIIDDKFRDKLTGKKLVSRLPANVHLLPNGLTLRKGMQQMEASMERRLRSQDFTWAVEAEQRRAEELTRVRHYYDPLLAECEDPEIRQLYEERFKQRAEEIDWQYRPRVSVSVINCGLFHFAGID